MFNIKIRGDLKDEEQLKEGEVLPENSIMLNEGNKITDIMFKGFALALPGMLVMIALSYFKCKNMSVKLSLSPTVILAAISILAAINNSFNFRSKVLSLLRNRTLANCCVIVLPP